MTFYLAYFLYVEFGFFYFLVYNIIENLYFYGVVIMIKKFTIYGERCSGTNYLENLVLENFDVELTREYGSKHFFGFSDLSGSDDTLFIGIVRNPYDWFNSLYTYKHHLPQQMFKNINVFLTKRPHPMTDT
jgi:hypothetical protein